MKIGAIIQARSSSSRFPKKVLKSLPYGGDVCVLQQVIRRVSKSNLIDEVILATTTEEEDSEIVDIAIKEDIPYYRGSLENVLERYYKAAVENELDVIVRVTSDNPCIDYTIIDEIIRSHLNNGADYTTNTINETFPIGMSIEVINFNILERAHDEATETYEKEHVTPFIYKTHPNEFNINKFKSYDDNSDVRITLDTSQDYALLCAVFDNLYSENNYFLLNDILDLFKRKPYLKVINEDIIQKRVCSSLSEELQEVINLCDRQDLEGAKEFIEKHID